MSIKKIDLTRHICRRLVGHDNCLATRLIIGLVLMACGISISLYFGYEFQSHILHGIGDFLGYGIHGIGYAPYIEYALEE